MARFAHMADIHLGGWKQKPLQDLNFKSFQNAVGLCISRKVDFVLIAGDLFDSPYPSIEVLKETFAEFKKLKDAGIPCFMIAGSHDYSASGKTFLDVLEKTGFCKNVANFEESESEIVLNPTIHNGLAIYGFPGKKTGLEVQDIKKIRLGPLPSESMYKILMLHTTLDRVVGDLPIDSVDSSLLPKTDYCALGHIHVLYDKDGFVYPGPLFPNNFKELEDLSHGHFVFADTSTVNIERIKVPLKEVEKISLRINDGLTATERIISEIQGRNIRDKVILLRISGELEKGKNSDIDFQKIEKFAMESGAYFMLKNTHDLKARENSFEFEIKSQENAEEEAIKLYSEQNPSEFNSLVLQMINALSIEKQEGETSENFTRRITDEAKKILNF